MKLLIGSLLFIGCGLFYYGEQKSRSYQELVQNTEASYRDLQVLKDHEVALTRENLEVLRNNQAHLEGLLEGYGREIPQYGGEDTPSSFNFWLVDKFEGWQELSDSLAVDPLCFFGFREYLETKKLPPEASVTGLYQQCSIVEYLIHNLAFAGGSRLVSLKRECCQGEAASKEILSLGMALPANETWGSDYYEIAFQGSVDSLRQFMSKLGRLAVPIFVKGVTIHANATDGRTYVLLLQHLKPLA